MTRQESFSNDEWALLGDAPLAAAAAVAVASPGGGRREAAAMVEGWREAGARFGSSELMGEVVAGLDPEARQGGSAGGAGYTYDTIIDEAVDLCSRAVALLGARAAPEEREEYMAFVINLAERVAWANSEGGFMGVGGEAMSREERTVMGAVARALGYGRG
jgi:hypothetical protein